MTTQKHIVVEIEESALGILVGGIDRGVAHVLQSLRVPLAEVSRDALVNALRSIDGEMLAGVDGVHLLISDRRLQHFTSVVPAMAADEAVAFVVREALRLCGSQSTADVMVATRLMRRLPGRRLQLSTAALARPVFEPIRAAFAAHELAVASLHATETLLAMAAESPDGKPVAVLECSSSRARFVLCDGQSPLQVRRFLVGGAGEGNSAALATQLVMELPRTFDWLRETAQPLPTTLLLGSRVGIDDEAIELLKVDEFERVERAPLPAVVDEGQPMPTLAALTLLREVCRGRVIASLLDAPNIVLPWSPRQLLPLAAALVVAGIGTASAVVDFRAAERAAATATASSTDNQAVAAAIARLEETKLPTPEGSSALDQALLQRRPWSRLLAEVSAAASASVGPDIQVEELKFSATEPLSLVGVVQGGSRRDALAAIASFAKRLGGLPFVQANDQDDITEVARERNCFRFRIGLAWRNL
jgi:Tfp pilus assembly protein PilN